MCVCDGIGPKNTNRVTGMERTTCPLNDKNKTILETRVALKSE